MPSPLADRISTVLSEQEIKQADLKKVTGRSKGLVNQWCSGIAQSIDYADAKKISRKYGYAIEWLMYGSDPKMTPRRSKLKGGELSDHDVEGQAPLISKVAAGKFSEAVDSYRVGEAEGWYAVPRKSGPRTYCLKVDGDSMTSPYGKSYPKGCIIFVDPDRRSPSNGDRVIAKLKGTDEVTFKVFVQEAGKVFLKPLNQQHPAILEPFKVIGTVIGKWEDE